jgi:hypothetical protein
MVSAMAALHTYVLANFDNTKVVLGGGTLAADPDILLETDDEAPSENINGEVKFRTQINGGNTYSARYVQKRFIIQGHCYHEGAPNDSTITDMLSEVLRWANKYNQTSSNPWWYRYLDDDWNGSLLYAQIDFKIEAYSQLLIVDGT